MLYCAELDEIVLHLKLSDFSVPVSARIGVTVYPSDNIDEDELLRNADEAMYLSNKLVSRNFAYMNKIVDQAKFGQYS